MRKMAAVFAVFFVVFLYAGSSRAGKRDNNLKRDRLVCLAQVEKETRECESACVRLPSCSPKPRGDGTYYLERPCQAECHSACRQAEEEKAAACNLAHQRQVATNGKTRKEDRQEACRQLCNAEYWRAMDRDRCRTDGSACHELHMLDARACSARCYK